MIHLLLALTAADFPICAAPGFTGYPAVTFAHDNYYVFWVDQRQSPLTSVYGARVTRSGTVLDPGGVELYTDSAGYRCGAAADGDNLLVVVRNHC
jgi:hypothetical protein